MTLLFSCIQSLIIFDTDIWWEVTPPNPTLTSDGVTPTYPLLGNSNLILVTFPTLHNPHLS